MKINLHINPSNCHAMRILSIIFIVGLFIQFSFAQVNTYAFTQQQTEFRLQHLEHRLGNGFNNGSIAFLDDSGQSTTLKQGPGIPIGFTFVYGGIPYDRIGIVNNGWIALGQSKYGTSAVDLGQYDLNPLENAGPALDTLRSRIVAFDAPIFGNGNSSTLEYELLGQSPNRSLVIKWSKYRLAVTSATDNFTNLNFEIVLNEADNSIELIYGQMKVTGTSVFTECNIGLGGLSKNEFNNRKTQPNKNWNTTLAGNTEKESCLLSATSIMPAYGTVFRYTPPLCFPISGISIDQLSPTSATTSWHHLLPAPYEYEYAFNQVNVPPTSGTIIQDSFIHHTMLSANTSYYLHIKNRCSIDTHSVWKSFPIHTPCLYYSLPYNEHFDALPSVTLPSCYTVVNANANSPTWTISQENPASFPNHLFMEWPSNYGVEDWLILPPFSLTKDSTYVLTFDVSFNGSFNDAIYLGMSTSPDVHNMVIIDTILSDDSNTYHEYAKKITATSTATHYFALFTEDYYINIDNIHFNKDDCDTLASIAVTTNVIGTTTVHWSPVESGSFFEYCLSTDGNIHFDDIQTTMADSIQFIDLDPGKYYSFFIRKHCSTAAQALWQKFNVYTKSDIDECNSPGAIYASIDLDCTEAFYFSTFGATTSTQTISSCGYTIANRDVWLEFNALKRSHKIQIFGPCTFGGGGGGGGGTRNASSIACPTLVFELYKEACTTLLYCDTTTQYGMSVAFTQFEIDSTYKIRIYDKYASGDGRSFGICITSFQTPINDLCTAAISLPVDNACNVQYGTEYNLAACAVATGPASVCDSGPYYDIWYKFIATAAEHYIEALFRDDGDGVLELFSGTCPSPTLLKCVNNTTNGIENLVATGLTIGNTYLIRAYDAGNVGANTRVSVCVKNSTSNDLCSNAIAVNLTTKTMEIYQSTSTALASGSGSCGSNFADDDVWYKFTAAQDSHLIVVIPTNPIPNIVKPVIELFGESCASSSMACSDKGELMATSLIPGQTYYFRIYSKAQSSGQGNFRVCVVADHVPYYVCNESKSLIVNATPSCQITNRVPGIGTGIKNEIWVKFIANDTSQIITCDGLLYGPPTGFALYNDCNNPFPLAQSSDYGILYYHHCVPGNTYYIRLANNVFPPNYTFLQDTFDICITPTISNDEKSNAIAIVADTICNYLVGTNVRSTPSAISSSCFFGNNNFDVWYKFVATNTFLQLNVTGSGSEFVNVINATTGESVACFSSGFFSPDAIGRLNNLIIGQTYYVRVTSSTLNTGFGQFQICLLEAPSNDHCDNAYELEHTFAKGCQEIKWGTLRRSTPTPLGSYNNVWYKFKAVDKKAIIRVNPLERGFDPAIKLWNASTGIFYDKCTYTQETQSDDTHLDFEPEMVFLTNLVIGNTYYIEVLEGVNSQIEASFEICLSSFNSNMTIHNANFKTYDIDTVVSKGTWHQAVSFGQLYYSGNANHLTIGEMVFHTNDTLLNQYIDKAYVYLEANAYPINVSTPEKFSKFGKAGTSFIGPSLPPIEFASAVPDAKGRMVFKGHHTLSTLFSQNNLNLLRQKIYLVYDINCTAPIGKKLYAICDSIQFLNDEVLTPTIVDSVGLMVAATGEYHTRQDGSWHDPDTWMCGNIPPNNYQLPTIHINHNIQLDDSVNCGDLVINYKKTLAMFPKSYLELGRNSQGSNTGFSNKYLDCTQGSLTIDSATLVVNGAFAFGTQGGDLLGNGLSSGGNYILKYGNDTIAQSQPFHSYASHSFCIDNGIINTNATSDANQDEIQLFKPSTSRYALNDEAISISSRMVLDDEALSQLKAQDKKNVHLNIPIGNHQSYSLILTKSDESEIKAYTMPGHQPIPETVSKHYTGKILGIKSSLVTLSIFKNELIGFIDDGHNQQTLIKKGDEYLLYALTPDESSSFQCGSSDAGGAYASNVLSALPSSNSVYNKCIKVLLEIENDVVVDKGGVTATYNYISALFNTVKALYAQDSINVNVSEILLWTAQHSPYTGSNMQNVLEKFSNDKQYYNGDMALLISYEFNGGVGYIDGLCNPVRKYSCAYAGITNDFLPLPAYSWPVYVVAHELGHVLGSRHTHACVWNGNGTPIDGCYTPEGNCGSAPIPETGGTIMSYCHYTENGINFGKGFGPQPLAVIKNNIINADCVQACGNTPCNQNNLTFTLRTDFDPEETSWVLVDLQNHEIASGGPYFIANNTFTHNLCLPDGCYTLKIFDGNNEYPSGNLDIRNSVLIFDGNDGSNASSNKTNFNILSSNFQFDHLDIRFLDPAINANNNFSFFPLNDGAFYLNGKITTGGGDDSYSNNHLGFLINNMALIEGSNPRLRIDTLHVKGGLYNDNRHTRAGGNFNWLGTLIVDQDCEYTGRFGVDENIINNGYITNRREANEFISFGKMMDIGNHYINGTNPQTISGSGFYRSSFSDPYPSNSNENRINKMICNNSKGIHLNTNLNVYDELVLRRGLLYTHSNALISLGDTAHQGRLFADPSNALVFSSHDTISSIDMWNGGFVYGPMKRYFSGTTLPQNSIFPLGDSTINRSIALLFANTNLGSVTAKYVKQDPTGDGLPLFNEQNTSVMGVSPTAYWHIDSVGVSGNYDMHVNAQNFEEIKGKPITSLNNVRIIKRHSNTWQHSTSTTTTGPSSLSKVEAKNFSGFSDFGIGIGQDTSLCGLWVYNDADNAKGSLRYVLNNCATNGDVIKIVSTIDTVYLTIDSLLINKDISIKGTNQSNYPKIMAGKDKKAFEIAAANTVRLSDLKIVGDSSNAIATVKNNGALTLQNIVMQNKNGKSVLINTAILNIEKGVRIE